MHKYYESRKIARERWRKTEHGKKWTQDYMREYRTRPYVKARYHEYYVKNKMFWGEIKKAKQRKSMLETNSWFSSLNKKLNEREKQRKANNWGGKREKTMIYERHADWAKENGYRENDTLNALNTERFLKDAQD